MRLVCRDEDVPAAADVVFSLGFCRALRPAVSRKGRPMMRARRQRDSRGCESQDCRERLPSRRPLQRSSSSLPKATERVRRESSSSRVRHGTRGSEQIYDTFHCSDCCLLACQQTNSTAADFGEVIRAFTRLLLIVGDYFG